MKVSMIKYQSCLREKKLLFYDNKELFIRKFLDKQKEKSS